MDETADILIIGGGMAGLSAARHLGGTGARIVALDKGRGPGGRMATRRAEFGGAQLRFDHGAQYFTARDPAFRDVVAAWEQAGLAARWPAAGEEAWVGTPGMNACVRALAEGLGVRWGVRAARLERRGARWSVATEEGARFTAAAVLVAVPAEQAADLLADAAPAFAARAAAVRSAPCWAVMATFAAPLPLGDVLRPAAGPVSWAARNSAKPGRGGPEAWVIHASPSRSRELVELPKEAAARILLAEFFAATGIAPAAPTHCEAHRWLYALPEARPGEGPLHDPVAGIGIAGDWLHSPRVEGAWLSGRALAAEVLAGARFLKRA